MDDAINSSERHFDGSIKTFLKLEVMNRDYNAKANSTISGTILEQNNYVTVLSMFSGNSGVCL